MVGANYTGGRRNAAKARSKDTTGRLQRGHFSKQRLGILTDALRSRRPDHHPLPSAVADDPNLTSNPRSGFLISPSSHSACTPAATVYDISLGHAKRDLAQKQRQRRQSTQQDPHPHRNDGRPSSSSLQPGQSCLDPSVRDESPADTSLALPGKGEPDLQILLPATTSTAAPSSPSRPLPQPSSHPEPAFALASLPEEQPTPVTGIPSKRQSKILDSIDISDPTSVRAQIDRILAFPSLLGVVRCVDTRGPFLSADIDNDNAVPARGDGEVYHAVNDLQPGPIQTRNQIPVWKHARHRFRPSDPTAAVINRTDLDRDHRQHHQLTPLAIQSRANSTDRDLLTSPGSKSDRDGDGGSHKIAAPDLAMGSAPEIETCVPRGQKRDFGCTPGWNSNPSSDGNAQPEMQVKADPDEYDTNVDDRTNFNVNFGFGSKTVDPFSLPRVRNSISGWDVFGLASPILGKRTRTEVETPLSKLAPVLSSPPSVFSQIDGGGTRSASPDHVLDSSRTPSRYPRSSSRSEPKKSFPLRSHDCLQNNTVKSVVDATGWTNARTPVRQGLGSLRKVSGEEQRVEFRISSADVQSPINEGGQEKRHEQPRATTVASDLNVISPGSFPSDLQIRSCSPTAGSLSPRTEVLSGFGFSQVHSDHDTGCALRWGFRQDVLDEVVAGKIDTEECGDHLGGAGSMHDYHPNRRPSVFSVDGLDIGGEFYCTGMGGVSDRMERFARADASRDWDSPRSRRSSLTCSTPGYCADANVKSGSQNPPVGFCSIVLPHCRHRYPGLSSDSGSVLGSRLQHHVKDQTMGSIPSPGSRPHPRILHRTSMSSPFKAFSPSSSTSLEEVPCTCDARVLQDNAELNANGNGSWLIHTHEHAHEDTQEFDMLRFSSSSPSTSISGSISPPVSTPSNLLLDGKDKSDESADSEAGGSGSGSIGILSLNEGLGSYMKTDMTPDSSTRTRLNGGANEALLNHNLQERPLTSFINNGCDTDGSDSRHVVGRDMGGVEHEGLGPLDLGGCASSVSVSVSGFASRVSGVTAAGSLFPPAPRTRLHSNEEDTRSPAPLDSGTMAVQSWSAGRGEAEEPEECGLLKSLLESSDPWGLMRKKTLNLPSPTPSEVERRSKREEEDMAMVRGSLGRRGVGYVTPPSMDALLGVVDLNGGTEMKDVKGGDGNEDSQEILDFRSSQPHIHCDTSAHCGRSTPGVPPSDLAHMSTKMDISSNPLGSPSPSPRFRPYRDVNHAGDRNNLDTASKSQIDATSRRSGLQSRQDKPRETGQSTRKRSSRSSDSEGSEDPMSIDDDLAQGEREGLVTLPSVFGTGSSVFVPMRLPWSVPGDSGIDGANAEEGALRRYRKVGRNDRWTNTGTIAVPGGDGHDYSPTLCHVEPGNILVTDGPGGRTRTKAGSIHSPTDKGLCRARESRRTTIESLPLVEPSGMEPRLVGFPAAEHCDDVGSQPYKPETGDETYGRWGESGRRTRPNANTADSDPVASGCGGSNSLLKPARPVRGGRVKGIECETEACGLVPGRDLQEETGACPNNPPCQRDDWGRDKGGETERLDNFVLPVSADSYVDFAFSLDDTAYNDSKRTSEPSVTARLGYLPVSETLRRLEPAIGLPTSAETTVDLIPVDFDVILSGSTPQLRSSGEGETQGLGKLSSSSLSLLPFQLSASKFPTMVPSPLSLTGTLVRDHALTDLDLGSSLGAPVEVMSRTSRVPAAVSGSELMLGSALTNSDSVAIQEKVFSGPSLFLDDDA